MSFNQDQLDYMRSMREKPPAEKCYCAWFRMGECPHCPPDLSAADRIPFECKSCHNYPPAGSTEPITHSIGCKTPDWQPASVTSGEGRS